MQQVLSREILWPRHIDSSHAHKAYEFEGWQYRVEVVLEWSGVRQAPVPASVTIASFTDGNEFVDTVIPGPKDRRHFAESVFLLAAKLKYDLLRGILYDRAGFLHSTEIKRLNEAGRTKSQPTIYGAMRRLYRKAGESNSPEWSFFRKFFKERDQLWHFMCFCGRTAGSISSQDLVWWLNIGPESVSFRDASGNPIGDHALKEMLAGLFPEKCLFKAEELQEFVKRLDLGPKAGEHRVEGEVYAEAEQSELLSDTNLAVVFDDITKELNKTKGQEVLPDPGYYLGKNAELRHIMAWQDVVRPDLMAKIFGHLYKNNICVIRSESGQGKSTLMYRFAFDHKELFHILEIKHFDGDLVRPVELALKQLTTLGSKYILILANEVTELSGWALFLNSVKRNNRVCVLATTRSDKWDLSKMKGLESNVEIVEPVLDRETAADIYRKLEERGLVKAKGWNWSIAFGHSGGKLIELVTMLTQGTYLKELLSVEVAKMPQDVSEILRIISTADAFGIDVDFSLLQRSLEIHPSRPKTSEVF